MPGLNDLLKDKQAQTLISNREKLGHLMESPETQQLFSMLDQHTDCTLKEAAEHAAKGDTAQLMSAIKHLMNDPEGARLIQQMRSKLK